MAVALSLAVRSCAVPRNFWWAHSDSNRDPTGYEPVALPVELWAYTQPARSLMVAPPSGRSRTTVSRRGPPCGLGVANFGGFSCRSSSAGEISPRPSGVEFNRSTRLRCLQGSPSKKSRAMRVSPKKERVLADSKSPPPKLTKNSKEHTAGGNTCRRKPPCATTRVGDPYEAITLVLTCECPRKGPPPRKLILRYPRASP